MVTVWGNEDEIAVVTDKDIRVRVDVSGITEEGDYVLPAVVTATDESSVTVRGAYQVTVHVTKRETPPDTATANTANHTT